MVSLLEVAAVMDAYDPSWPVNGFVVEYGPSGPERVLLDWDYGQLLVPDDVAAAVLKGIGRKMSKRLREWEAYAFRSLAEQVQAGVDDYKLDGLEAV